MADLIRQYTKEKGRQRVVADRRARTLLLWGWASAARAGVRVCRGLVCVSVGACQSAACAIRGAAALTCPPPPSTPRISACRGLQLGDVAIIDMRICPPGSEDPYPGLDKKKLALDTEADPLGLAKVRQGGVGEGGLDTRGPTTWCTSSCCEAACARAPPVDGPHPPPPHTPQTKPQNMVGMATGEERSWAFTFPADWHVELWRGQAATATVKVRELFEWDLAPFDDAFVAAHYPTFEGADDMRKSLLATTAMERFRATQIEARAARGEGGCACVGLARVWGGGYARRHPARHGTAAAPC